MVKMFSDVTPTSSFAKARARLKKLFEGRVIASGEEGGQAVEGVSLFTGFLQHDVSTILIFDFQLDSCCGSESCCGSVADPNPDLPDPHVVGPPGSGSTSQRYGSGSGSCSGSGYGSFYHHA